MMDQELKLQLAFGLMPLAQNMIFTFIHAASVNELTNTALILMGGNIDR